MNIFSEHLEGDGVSTSLTFGAGGVSWRPEVARVTRAVRRCVRPVRVRENRAFCLITRVTRAAARRNENAADSG